MSRTLCLLTAAALMSTGLAVRATAQTLSGSPSTFFGKSGPNLPTLDPIIRYRLATAPKGERIKIGHFSGANKTNAASAQPASISKGWNYFNIHYCYGFTLNGIDYMYMIFTDGSYLLSGDRTFISAAGAICTSAPFIGFNITSISGNYFTWNDVIVPHQ